MTALQSVVISVSDLEKSLAFYRDLLGLVELDRQPTEDGGTRVTLDAGGGHTIQLVRTSVPATATTWNSDDLQVGLRHAAFKVRDVDATTARLKAANVPFALDPLDAVGGVRIAFFFDPDGAYLELVQGELSYHVEGSAVHEGPSNTPTDESLQFDHVAVSVSNLDSALAFYEKRLGCPIIGQLLFKDERDFTITYLKAGSAVLELFSYSSPTLPNAWDANMASVGLKYFVLDVSSSVADDLSPGREYERALIEGFDGTPFEWRIDAN